MRFYLETAQQVQREFSEVQIALRLRNKFTSLYFYK